MAWKGPLGLPNCPATLPYSTPLSRQRPAGPAGSARPPPPPAVPARFVGGTAEAIDRHRGQHGGQVGRWTRGPAELLLEDRGLDQSERAAAHVLGQGEAKPAELRHLFPQRLAFATRVVPQRAHVGRLAVLVQERARGRSEERRV